MKKNVRMFAVIIGLMTVFCAGGKLVNAQTPQAFKYQTVARNNAGDILASQNITFRMTILQGELPGTMVYTETHAATTNATGLATLEIGRGTPVTGSFAAINWSMTPIFLKTEIDPAGGTAFVEMGTSELLSVPYSLFAETAGNGFSGNYNDLSNKPVTDGSETKVTAGTNVTITGTGTAASPYVVNSAGSSGGGGFTHYIGELYGGGIVFHVFKDADGTEHGLVVSLIDLSTGAQWGLYGYNVPNCESTWDGQANTIEIINTNLQAPATELCDDYTGGGFTDWYLPAKDELNQIYNNLFNVNRTLSQTPGAFGFAFAYYWSSSESISVNAWKQDFTNGNQSILNKGNPGYVRAVRAF